MEVVDFNNETTIGTPAGEVVKILILQRRNDLIDALEFFYKQESRGTGDLALARCRMFSMFLEIQAALKRKLKPTDYNRITEIALNKNSTEEMIREFIYEMNDYLDRMGLIKTDNTPVYDKTRTAIEDKIKGYS